MKYAYHQTKYNGKYVGLRTDQHPCLPQCPSRQIETHFVDEVQSARKICGI